MDITVGIAAVDTAVVISVGVAMGGLPWHVPYGLAVGGYQGTCHIVLLSAVVGSHGKLQDTSMRTTIARAVAAPSPMETIMARAMQDPRQSHRGYPRIATVTLPLHAAKKTNTAHPWRRG